MKQFLKFTLATITGIVVTSLLGILFLMMLIGIVASSTEKSVSVQNNSMLTIKLDGEVVDRAPNDPFSSLEIPGFFVSKKIGLNDILTSIDQARYDDRIKCIYLDLSAVNAAPAMVEEIRNALISFRDSSDKPVYAYADNLGQPGYYLASVADKVVLNPQGTIDWRGIGGEAMFFKNALEKLGVEMQVVRHGKFKAAVEPFLLDHMSDENREQTLSYLNALWSHMVMGVSAERGISAEQLNLLADEVLTLRRADKALQAGMIDALQYKDEVLDDLREITGTAAGQGIPTVGVTDYAKVPVKKTSGKSGYSRNKIAVIYASGDIGMPSSGSEGISGEKLSREIRKVRLDSTFKAIVLRIDSPGGSAYESEVIWREVMLAAQEKTVVASMSNLAASGGYYIACAAHKIVASPLTITGSIGIFALIPNASELITKKMGINIEAVKTNQHTDILSLTRPMTRFERDLMQNYIEEGYDVFISRVAEGRNMEKAEVDQVAEGRVWAGEDALRIGLVDQLGGLKDAIALAAELAGLENYRTVDLPALQDPFQQLFKTGSDNVRTRFLKHQLGDAWEYYQNLEKSAAMSGVLARMPYDMVIR